MSSTHDSFFDLRAFATVEHALGGRYVLTREIGRGGMAVVMLAQDLRHERAVAVKLLRTTVATAVSTERFLREIHIAASLTHPHILPVHDSGVEQGLFFYVMPFVEGDSLATYLAKQGALSIDETLRFVQQIGSALHHAHTHGIVHRDVKPENVLLPGGVAVVADFGLARAVQPDPDTTKLTDVGMGMGSPRYISPEQALGENDVDARTDQYSLAVMAYEMLAGQTPFAGVTAAQLVAQHITKSAPKIRSIRSDIPVTIQDALDRALAKNPRDRFASIVEFVAALDGGAVRGTTPSRPLPIVERVRLHQRTLVASAALMLVALAAALVYGRTKQAGTNSLDPNLVAIAPFNAVTPPLQLWKEGLMDVLARSLDGAGPLRTVSPTVVIRSWKERSADQTSASELGQANRAGLAVFGTLMEVGQDSVRATVTVFDVAGDSALGPDVEIRGELDRMDRVADSIAVRTIRQIVRARSIVASASGSLRSHSLPALKAFLRGEQLYRNNNFAAAQVAYEDAVTNDSTFALAYHRLRNVLRWLGTSNTPKLLAYAQRAGVLNHGLAPRDSLMILADSLLPDPLVGAFLDNASVARSRRRLAVLTQATVMYPDDPETWAELGEARTRSRFGTDAATALQAFEKAIAVDSLFGPSFSSAIGLSLALRSRDSLLTLTRRYLRFNPGDKRIAAIDAILKSDGSDQALRKVLTTLNPADAGNVGLLLAKWPDDGDTGARLFRVLASEPSPQSVFHGALLRHQGRVREAVVIADLSYRHSIGGASELLFYSRYSTQDAAAFDSLSIRWLAEEQRNVWPLMVTRAADRGDTAALQQLQGAAAGRAIRPALPAHAVEWQYIANLSAAYLSLARGDSALAERRFGTLADSLAWLTTTMPAVLDAASLLTTRGQATQALALLERNPANRGGAGAWQPQWHLQVALAAARAGDLQRANANFEFVKRAWRRADPPLKRLLAASGVQLARQRVP